MESFLSYLQNWVKRLNELKTAGIVVLTMLLALIAIQQAYAVRFELPPPPVSSLIESVSNSSGDCLNLGLKGYYGTITISLSRLWVFMQNAKPNSTYIVWVGYVQTGGSCVGNWKPVGSVSTNGVGEGSSAQWFTPPSTYSYFVFEFKNSSGTIVYGTHALSS